MKTKNLTPFVFGCRVTSRRPPQPEMTIIVRGRFVLVPGGTVRPAEAVHPLLAHGPMTSDVFREGDDERQGECLYPSDFADFKLRADVMLRGTCHAPGGIAVPECPVRFSVGSWTKILRVIGPRVWIDGLLSATPSEPVPFVRMPIDYAHAFGGPGYAPNPVGRGIATLELPSVEHAGDLIRSRKDRLPPAGFGPISPLWPERAGKLGKNYGRAYAKTRAPFCADDFDWTHFNAAPPDQQLPGYLAGNEELILQNLHPTLPVLTTRLPGLRIRAFVKDATGRLREVRMNLDTLFVDADHETVTLVWRGIDGVQEDDLRDVHTLLIASEPMGEPALSGEHYREIIEAFEKDPLGIDEHMPEHLREAAKRVVYDKGLPASDVADPQDGPLDPISALLQNKLGGLAAPEQRRIREAVQRILAAPMPEGVDITARIAEAITHLPPGPATPLDPPQKDKPPVRDARIGKLLSTMRTAVDKLKQDAAAQGRTIQGLAAYEALANDPRIKQLEAAGAAREPPQEPGPGRDLSGQDLSRRDLSGMDLRGANLEEAILQEALLRGTNLSGARMKHAVLFQADLSGADLTGADLTGANLGGARAAKANFNAATLDRAVFDKTDLTGASLSGATGAEPILSSADLSGANAKGVRLFKALCRGACLEAADFSGADLTQCQFLEVRARKADFSGATLTKTNFMGSDLGEARFTGAAGQGCIWTGALLEQADFGHAVLLRAHFFDVNAARARFYGAHLEGGRFYRAALGGAEFVSANLAGADFTKATLDGASLAGSNLFQANLLKVPLERCDLTGAVLTRSSLERE
jgi:uncharacterized protein YjbI with pentapeptide repeats